MTETRVAVISIIIDDRQAVSQVNDTLHEYSQYVIGRMGIPYRQRKISIICVAVDAPQSVTSALSGKIGRIEGVNVKTAYSNSIASMGE